MKKLGVFLLGFLIALGIIGTQVNALDVYGELRYALLEKLAADPANTEARVYYDTVNKVIKYYDGTAWRSIVPNSGGTFTGDLSVGSSTGSAFLESSAGTVSNPSHSFVGDTDTGMWRSSSNVLSFSMNGIEGVDFDSSAVYITRGAANTQLNMRRAGTSVASPSVVASGDATASLNTFGYSGAGSTYRYAAGIDFRIDGEPDTASDTTDMPGRIEFLTTPDGSSTGAIIATITSDAVLYMGSAISDAFGWYTVGTTGTTTCETACGTEPASMGTSSGRCIAAWRRDTQVPLTTGTFGCTDATSVNKRCICGGIHL